MDKEIKELIAKLKKEGKSAQEIARAVLLKYAELGQSKSAEVIANEVVEEVKTIEALAEIDEQFKEINKKSEIEKTENEINERFEKFEENLLSKISRNNEVIEKKSEFQSEFMKSIVEVKDDNSWKSSMRKMLVADRTGDFKTAREVAIKHMEKSILYSDDFKKTYLQKVLTGDTTTGSYAVPDEYSDRVIVKAQRLCNIFENATKLSMSSDKLNLLSSGDVTFTEVTNQSTALTESEPVFAQDSLDLVDAGAFTYIHNNLIADSNVDVIGILENAYSRGLAKYLKRATTIGNIATTGDKVNGVYSISGIGSVSVLDAEGGTVTYDDILNLMGTVDEVFWDGAVFEMNLAELLMVKKIKDSQGRPIFVEATNGLGLGTILGYPVRLNNQMTAVLDSSTGARTGGGESTILFGNPVEIFIGFKGGMEFQSSAHFKFTGRQETFRGFIRWDQELVNADAYGRLTNIKRA